MTSLETLPIPELTLVALIQAQSPRERPCVPDTFHVLSASELLIPTPRPLY